jgi:serine/threonine-protein kinase
LQHAYERGLVHRDIKPHNLLLAKSSDGQPLIKILDMGLARLDRGEDSMNSGTMTHEGAVMGTLDYIAPEQARNAHLADTRADLYSLGCTLYYLLTAQPLFPGGTPTEKLLKHQFQLPPSIHALRPDVPAPLAAVLQRFLAKQREQRFQTPAEAAAALSAVLSRAAVPVGQVAARATPVDTPLSDDGMFLPPAAAGEEMADTVAGWSEIIEAPAIGSSSSFRRRRADQRQHLVMWIVIGSLTLLALITLLLILL